MIRNTYIKRIKVVIAFLLFVSFFEVNGQDGDLPFVSNKYFVSLGIHSDSLLLNKKIIAERLTLLNQQQRSSIQINGGVSTVYMCGGSVKLYLSSVKDSSADYNWLDENFNVIHKGTEHEVSQPGKYWLFDQSSGGGQSVDVVRLPSDLSIYASGEGDDKTISTCDGQSVTLKINLKKPESLNIQWYFKPDATSEFSKISGANTVFYKTDPEKGQFGYYKVSVSPKVKNDARNESCSGISSKEVRLIPKSVSKLTVKALGEKNRVFLPGTPINEVLAISHDATGDFNVVWYMNGKKLATTGSEISILTYGDYYAEVIKKFDGGCEIISRSETFKIVNPVSFKAELKASDDYQKCISTSTVLSVSNVFVYNDKGDEFFLNESQIDQLQFSWFLDDQTLKTNNGKTRSINLTSFEQNGRYVVKSTYFYFADKESITGVSDEFEVYLTSDKDSYLNIVSSSGSDLLCPDSSIELSPQEVRDDFVYKWLKDGVEIGEGKSKLQKVNELGVYTLEIDIFGCVITSTFELKPFEDKIVKVEPGLTLALVNSNFVTAIASGANEEDGYQWYNERGEFISKDPKLQITEVGKYKLIAKVGNCSVERIVNVVDDDGNKFIPNVLTPYNADGINDFWELPNRFAFNEQITVLIYDSNGNEVFNKKAYQNDWPQDIKDIQDVIYYFRIIKEGKEIKAGTLSVLN